MADSISPIIIQPKTQTGLIKFVHNNATMIAIIAIPTVLVASYLAYHHFYGKRNVKPANPNPNPNNPNPIAPTLENYLNGKILDADLKTHLNKLKLSDVQAFISNNASSPLLPKAKAIAIALSPKEDNSTDIPIDGTATPRVKHALDEKADEILTFLTKLEDKETVKTLAFKTSKTAIWHHIGTSEGATRESYAAFYRAVFNYLSSTNLVKEYYESLDSFSYSNFWEILDTNQLVILVNTNFSQKSMSYEFNRDDMVGHELDIHFHTPNPQSKKLIPVLKMANENIKEKACSHIRTRFSYKLVKKNPALLERIKTFSEAYPEYNYNYLTELLSNNFENSGYYQIVVAVAFPKLTEIERKDIYARSFNLENKSFALGALASCTADERMDLYFSPKNLTLETLIDNDLGLNQEEMKDQLGKIKQFATLDDIKNRIKDYGDSYEVVESSLHVLALLIAKNNNERIDIINDTLSNKTTHQRSAFSDYCKLMNLKDNDDTYDFAKDLLDSDNLKSDMFEPVIQTLKNHDRLKDFHNNASQEVKDKIENTVSADYFK